MSSQQKKLLLCIGCLIIIILFLLGVNFYFMRVRRNDKNFRQASKPTHQVAKSNLYIKERDFNEVGGSDKMREETFSIKAEKDLHTKTKKTVREIGTPIHVDEFSKEHDELVDLKLGNFRFHSKESFTSNSDADGLISPTFNRENEKINAFRNKKRFDSKLKIDSLLKKSFSVNQDCLYIFKQRVLPLLMINILTCCYDVRFAIIDSLKDLNQQLLKKRENFSQKPDSQHSDLESLNKACNESSDMIVYFESSEILLADLLSYMLEDLEKYKDFRNKVLNLIKALLKNDLDEPDYGSESFLNELEHECYAQHSKRKEKLKEVEEFWAYLNYKYANQINDANLIDNSRIVDFFQTFEIETGLTFLDFIQRSSKYLPKEGKILSELTEELVECVN